MNEQEINTMLIKTRQLADDAYKHGTRSLGAAILQTGSKYALLQLKNVEKRYKPLQCRCGKQLTKGIEIEFYKNTGECMDEEKGRLLSI
jgi:hypothetical protein